jgi:hypothetical protein
VRLINGRVGIIIKKGGKRKCLQMFSTVCFRFFNLGEHKKQQDSYYKYRST